MNKVFSMISKGAGFAYTWAKHLQKEKTTVQNGQILIIAAGHIGNAFMDVSALEYLTEFYHRQGKQVSFLCSKEMWRAFVMLMNTAQITFLGEEYYYEGSGAYFHTVKQTLDAMKGRKFEKIIVTLTSCDRLAHYVAVTTPTNEIWGVFNDVKHNYVSPRYYFERYYTHKILVPVDMHETQRLKLLLERLGCKGYQTRIQQLPKQREYPARDKYITLAVDSMSTQRRWVSEKFVALVQGLLDMYPYDVCLTGNHVSESDADLYNEAFQNQARVKNYINKTGFYEWVEMLRYSQFHIGVDSGSIHVAASVGTQAFCLSGVWDGKRCLPYDMDVPIAETVEPVCVYRSDVDVDKISCYGCKAKREHIGRGNKECYRACKNGKPCLCIQRIEVEDVLSVIRMNIE